MTDRKPAAPEVHRSVVKGLMKVRELARSRNKAGLIDHSEDMLALLIPHKPESEAHNGGRHFCSGCSYTLWPCSAAQVAMSRLNHWKGVGAGG